MPASQLSFTDVNVTPQRLLQLIQCRTESDSAKALIRGQNYDQAISKLCDALAGLCGAQIASQIPLDSKHGGGMNSDAYMSMDAQGLAAIMESCVLIAECFHKKGQLFEALYWLTELHAIQRMVYRRAEFTPMFEWMDASITIQNFFESKVAGFKREADIFLELGNTGAVMHRLWQGCQKVITHVINATENHPEIGLSYDHLKEVARAEDTAKLLSLRHPDPSLVGRLEIKDPRLQVLGSWQKLDVSGGNSILPRHGFCSFVWKSRFYVLGGEKQALGPWYRDFHYIDLNDTQAGWKLLPQYPVAARQSSVRITGFKMEVDSRTDKAYFFHGRKKIDVFNLKTNTWSQVQTRMAAQKVWPIEPGYADFCMAITRGKLYTFGGTTPDWALGDNLLMELDLDTYEWKKLSGDHGPRMEPDIRKPGPRKQAAMWVDKAGTRLWIMYGEADRAGAQQMGQTKYAADESFVQFDCWSWNIPTKHWRQERIVGNIPCPRAEMGVTHNEALDKVIMFGGYNAAVPTNYTEARRSFSFSYYADTFVLDTTPSDGSAPAWRQVLTSGFPTYRAQCKIFSDPSTGKPYLFGGYVNNEFIPGRANIFSRAFDDLFQLKLDVPGGCFQDVNVEEELRIARLGPWKRCYGCGNIGRGASLKKCRGSCRGIVMFCSLTCQRQTWNEHREAHACGRM